MAAANALTEAGDGASKKLMETMSPSEILAAFPRHERRKAALPIEPQWSELDFLGWIHRSGHLGFIICPSGNGIVGLVLERSVIRTRGPRRFMCDMCCTLHEQGGVARFTRWDRARTQSRSHMLCVDLACSLYIRGFRKTDCAPMTETLDRQEKIKRLNGNLARIVDQRTFGEALNV